MSLFGNPRAGSMPVAAPPAQTSPRRRRGLFGRVAGNDGNPETPNAWDWLVLGPTAPDILQERSMRRGLFGQQIRQNKIEEADAERARAEREAALAALPPNMRQVAPFLTNEAVSNTLFPSPPSYEIDAEGRPYTIQNGSIQYGEGRIAVPPRGAGAGGAAPSGYRYTPTGDLEAIPGGPADVRATAEGRSRAAQMESSTRSLQNAVAAIDEAMPLVTSGNTGLMGQITRGVGGTGAYDLNQALEPVRAILSFETLAEMRRNSQTGGALGSIAVRELELLGNTMRSLDTAQGEMQMRRNLQAVRNQLVRTMQAIGAARSELEAGPTQQQTPDAGGVRVIELEPE